MKANIKANPAIPRTGFSLANSGRVLRMYSTSAMTFALSGSATPTSPRRPVIVSGEIKAGIPSGNWTGSGDGFDYLGDGNGVHKFAVVFPPTHAGPVV